MKKFRSTLKKKSSEVEKISEPEKKSESKLLQKPKVKIPPTVQNIQPPPKKQTPPPQTQVTPTPSPEDTSCRNAKTELSLNVIDLGLPSDQLTNKIGKPDKIENRDDGNVNYIYGALKIGIIDGKVHSLMTYDPKFKTLRGLHIGSNYGEVAQKYGAASYDMEKDNLILYEYPFTLLDGKNSLLRFAVKKSTNIVDYISVMIIEDPPKQTNSSITDANVKQAAMAFVDYHEAITDKSFSAAFNLLTDERKANIKYNVQAFVKGYANPLKSEVTDLKIVSSSSSRVVLNYVIDARDEASGGRVFISAVQRASRDAQSQRRVENCFG